MKYGGDRSLVAVDGQATLYHEDECWSVQLPREVYVTMTVFGLTLLTQMHCRDDEYLTDTGGLEQPPGHVSIMTGFVLISKLFRREQTESDVVAELVVAGELIEMRRSGRHRPPTGQLLSARLVELDVLYDRIMSLMDDCPDRLKLDMGPSPFSATHVSSVFL